MYTESRIRWRRSIRGVVGRIYDQEIVSSKRKGFPPPTYTRQWLFEFCSNDKVFIRLYEEWVTGGYKTLMKPSIDRVRYKLPYTPDNIRVTTWGDNLKKGRYERRLSGRKVEQLKDGFVIATYCSNGEAARQTGFDCGSINRQIHGKLNHVGGYQWRFAKESAEQWGPDILRQG